MSLLPAGWSPAHPIRPDRSRIREAGSFQSDETVRAQVCVIGTGAGGAAAARELAEGGLDVLMLEEGDYFTGEEYGRLSPMRSLKKLYRDAGLTFTMGAPNILLPFGKCVGGSTVINSGSAFRMDEATFAGWKRSHDLPGLEWDELSACFDRVEETVRVQAVPEELLGENGRIIRAGAEALGVRGEVVTRAVHGCLGRGRCYLGCPENAKQGTHLNYVPAALAAGARLFTGCRADRLVLEDGRVTGVEVSVRPDGGRAAARRLTVDADRVVVACGAVHSPLLLLRSKVARRNPHAGRHLRIHPASRVLGLFDREIRGHKGVPQSYHVTGRIGEGLVPEGVFLPPSLMAPAVPGRGRAHLDLMKRYPEMGLLGYRIVDTGAGEVRKELMGMANIRYDLSAGDTRRLLETMSLSAEILYAAGAKTVFLPIHGRGETRSMDEVRRALRDGVPATDIELNAYHPHGTLRMAAREEDGVTRPDGAVHEVENLHVADASLFPESSVVNPQIPIMALATLVARRILGD